MNIPKIVITRGSATLVVVILIFIWGINAYIEIPKREFPDVEAPACAVVTIWPGATPEKMEQMITEKIEDAVTKVENIKETNSFSRTGISVIYVEADMSKLFLDKQEIWDDVRKEIDRIQNQMPENLAFGPFVNDRFSKAKSMLIGISSDKRPYNELVDYAEALKDELKYLNTVNRSEISGETQEVIYLTSDERLEEYNINLFQVMQSLKARNITLSGGALSLSDNQLIIEPSGEFKTLNDIADVIINISPETGHPVYVRDLFTITRGLEDPPNLMAHVNGIPSLMVDVELREGKNVLEMGKQVEKVLARARVSFPEDINVTVIVDQPSEVRKKLNDFMTNLYQGIILIVSVSLLAIGFRPALIMATAIPLSLLITFGILPMAGRELENMVICGLIVSLGMIVDNAVVITDNIYRYMAMGFNKVEAGWRGTNEVAIPMLSATATTVAAFAPLVFFPGIVGDYIRSIPVTVIIAISTSYVVAITVAPLLSARLIKIKPGMEDPNGMPKGTWTIISKAYDKTIETALRIPKTVVAVATGAFLISLFLIPSLGLQFFPVWEKDLFYIEIWTPEGTDVPTTREIAAEVEKILDGEEDIIKYVTYTGKSAPRIVYSVMTQELIANYAQIWVRASDWKKAGKLIPVVRQKVRRQVAGARIEVKSLESGPPVFAPIGITIEGEDIPTLRQISEKVQEIIATEPATFAIHDNFGTEAYKIQVRLDEDEMKRTGLNNQEIAYSVMAMFTGLPATNFREEDKSIPIKIRTTKHLRDDFDDILETRIRSMMTEKIVALKQVGDIEAVPYVPVIVHKNGKRTLETRSFVEEWELPDNVLKRIWPKIKEIEIPRGISIDIAGEFEEREEAFGNLTNAFIFALILMILVLMINFNSTAKTFIIFSSIPLSLIGAVLGLFITGHPFGFMAFLGVASLSGIVLKNAIILIDFIDHSIEDGLSVKEAITISGKLRMRPIFVTTATTIGGLIPMAFRGGDLFAPMAWVLIFGLAVSTLLTLIVVPVLYYLLIGEKKVKTG